MTKGKHLVLGVTGSIAAYKAADLASALTKEGWLVDVVLTDGAQRFIRALTFGALTHRTVTTNLWDEEEGGRPTHIELADRASLVVVAPATANFLARYAQGHAPDALCSILLATPAPVLIAPAMNGKMWLHPAVQENVRLLKERNVAFVDPAEGQLACGYEGIGRLAPVETILDHIRAKAG